VNPGDRFAVLDFVPQMVPDGDRQSFLLGRFVRGHDAADAGRVGGDWLLHEDVFAGGHRRLELRRPKTGRAA
jgi:hypothetical protein